MYATLQEAFGVNTFTNDTIQKSTEPIAMRGDVAKAAKKHDRFQKSMLSERSRTAAKKKSNPCLEARLRQAHARGGAEAAWAELPAGIRSDMLRYVLSKKQTSPQAFKDDTLADVASVLLVGLMVLVLLA